MGALCTPLQQMLAQANDPRVPTVKPMSWFYDQHAARRTDARPRHRTCL